MLTDAGQPSITDRQDTYHVLTSVKRYSSSERHRTRSKPWQSLAASRNVWTRLERIADLGENDSAQGHSGCVNALHWSADGTVLVSAGDDTRIHLWRLDPYALGDYPLSCTAKIHTGHTNNIFNAHILPGSSRIATCAADRQVRVFDVNRGGLSHHSQELTEYEEQQACLKVLKCHRRRVKRIVTESSPYNFLTVAEDGCVRQHDLRTPHKCAPKSGDCPPPLVSLPLKLSTIALSPLTPYNFVVAGESPFGYLFDRRQIGRHLKAEWGVECKPEDLTSCIRRFGRRTRAKNEFAGQEHVTGSRMSQENGHELILSYSADAVYLYSIRDSPETQQAFSSIRSPNKRLRLSSPNSDSDRSGESYDLACGSVSDESGTSMDVSHDLPREQVDEVKEDENDNAEVQIPESLRLPIVYPRRQYTGACNVQTVKDVNFVGPRDEYVVSGSDDGNFFIWDKKTSQLLDIHEGDGSVVNVIEQHPSLPILSVSGIDTTVKIFAPRSGTEHSSRMSQSDEIVRTNISQTSPRLSQQRILLSDLFLQYRRAWSAAGELPDDAECIHQ